MINVSTKCEEVYGYDFDGVVSIGIRPRSPFDIIVTGRCYEEQFFVVNRLSEFSITNKIYFNPMTLSERGNHTEEARRFSAIHKVETIKKLLLQENKRVVRFFEDDPLQASILKENLNKLEVVLVQSSLVKL